jgi:hypothetical protein
VTRGASTHGRATLTHAPSRRAAPVVAALALALALAMTGACSDPRVDTPAAQHAARDLTDAAALARHLEVIPGVVRASAWLTRPFADPLAPPRRPGRVIASIAIVLAGDADRAAVETSVRTLAAQALAADASAEAATADAPQISVFVASALPPPPKLAHVGPFRVQASSRGPLIATFAAGLLAIVALCLWIVVIELRRRREESLQDSEPS